MKPTTMATRAPSAGPEGGPDPSAKQRFDALRVVVAAFRDISHAMIARRPLALAGVTSDHLFHLPRRAAEGWSPGGPPPGLPQDRCGAAVGAYLEDSDLAERCRDWLREGRLVMAVLAPTFPKRDEVADALAEVGGVVLGPSGKTFGANGAAPGPAALSVFPEPRAEWAGWPDPAPEEAAGRVA